MPGPKSASPRKPGPRPDPNGNPRKQNAKAAARLAVRMKGFEERSNIARTVAGGEKLVPMMNKPGSQNRKK